MDEGGHRVGHGQRVGRAVKVVKRAGYTLARLRYGLQSGYNIISNCCRKRERGLHLSDGPHGGEAVDEEGSKRPVKKQRHHVNIQAFTPSVIPVQPASVQPASGPSPSLLAAPSAAVGTDPNHTHAQDARRVMLARKQNVNGYTVVQRRQIVKQRLQNVFAKQAAAGLSHQSAMETAAIHLPGFNFGRNPRPGPISTAERSVGGGPVERVAARSAVLVSLASGAEKAQRGASGLAHAHGAISRRESVPLMQRLADKMAHAPPMGGRLMSTVPAFYKGSQGLKEDVLCDPQLPGHSPGAVTQSLDQAISQQTVANVERVDVVSEAAVKSASILTLASNKDLGVLSQSSAAIDELAPLRHDEVAFEEALYSHPNPAASSEQLVQVSKPSSMGMAAVPREAVLPGSGTRPHHQVDAAVEPAMEHAVEPAVEPAVYSPRQHPFSRARTAPAPTGPVLRVDGVLINPTTMVPPLNMPFVLAATSCIPHLDEALLHQAWDAEQAKLEQAASPDSLQSRCKAAQPEAAGAVALPTNPAVQASGSFGGADRYGRDPEDFSSGGGYYGPEPSHSYGCPGHNADPEDFSSGGGYYGPEPSHSYGRPGRNADPEDFSSGGGYYGPEPNHSFGRPACAAHRHSHGRPALSADDTSRDYSSVTSVSSDYRGADSASSVGNGIGTGSGGTGSGGSSGRRSSSDGSHVNEADSGFAPVPPGQRRVEGEEQGRGAGSAAVTSGRVTAKEEASRFLADLGLSFAVEAPGAESRKGSQGVGGVPMGASPSQTCLQAGNNLHEGRRQVNLECHGPVADADMEEEKCPDDELEDYVDTSPISWAPTFPAFLAPAAMGLPFPTQPAALGMPPIPPPPTPRGFPAAAESGSTHQPREHRKIPSRGGQKRKHQASSEGVKRLKMSGGAATAQLGSAQPPTLEGLSGGTAGAEQQGSAPANAMQESAALGTDVAAAEATGGEASTAKQGSDPAPTVCWGWNPRPSQLDAAADALRATTLMLQQQQQQK